MFTLLTIGISIAALLALILIIAACSKKAYAIEREVLINKPAPLVYNYVRFLRNHDNFSKWQMMDPNSKKEYRGTDGETGFLATWDSTNKNVGKGEQEIASLTPNGRIELNLHFIKPFEGRAKAQFIFEEATGNATKVKWGFNSSMPYPMNIMLLLMNMEKMLGNDLQEGLDNLKRVMEK